jgi:hypothetical protein
MPRDKWAAKPKHQGPGDYQSAKSIARIIVKQGEIGKYAGLFDFTCSRLADQPDDAESAELLAHLKSLRMGDTAVDEFDEAEPAR